LLLLSLDTLPAHTPDIKNLEKSGKGEEKGFPGPDDLMLLDKIWRGCGLLFY